jgi:CheY-like chemotaxis protein
MNLINISNGDVYRCHACSILNVSRECQWCLCAGAERTLVCGGCGSCFCDAPGAWKSEFWENASAELRGRKRSDRPTAPLSLVGQTPARPVILLIDDDRIVHSIVSKVLAGFSGTLLHAYDGDAGLRMALQVRPELVITDALLPKIDGREIARSLKSDPATSSMKVVVITAVYKGPRYRAEAFRDYLVDDFIEKPVSAGKLRTVINAMLPIPAVNNTFRMASVR